MATAFKFHNSNPVDGLPPVWDGSVPKCCSTVAHDASITLAIMHHVPLTTISIIFVGSVYKTTSRYSREPTKMRVLVGIGMGPQMLPESTTAALRRGA